MQSLKSFRRLLPALTASALASAVSADARIVDAAGRGDFEIIQDAIDAAVDGDTVLIRSGSYDGFTIDDRALTVAADSGAIVEITMPIKVENVSAGKRVTLSGMTVDTLAATPGDWIVQDCAGPVLIQDGRSRKGTPLLFWFGNLLSVQNSAAVVVTRFMSDVGLAQGSLGGWAGLHALQSTVSVYDSHLQGAIGVASGSQPYKGGPGIAVDGGTLFISGSTLQGGDGGHGVIPMFGFEDCTDGTDGGSGVRYISPATVRLLDTQLVAGAGGGAVSPCAPGVLGTEIDGTETPTTLAVGARHYVATTPIRDGETFVSTYTGEEGDLAFGFFAVNLFPFPFLPETNGPLFPSVLSAELSTIGILPASGAATSTFTAKFKGVAAEVFVQGLFFDPVDGFVLSNLERVLFLGPGL